MISMHYSLYIRQRAECNSGRNRRTLRVWRSLYPIIFDVSNNPNHLNFLVFSFESDSKTFIRYDVAARLQITTLRTTSKFITKAMTPRVNSGWFKMAPRKMRKTRTSRPSRKYEAPRSL